MPISYIVKALEEVSRMADKERAKKEAKEKERKGLTRGGGM